MRASHLLYLSILCLAFAGCPADDDDAADDDAGDDDSGDDDSGDDDSAGDDDSGDDDVADPPCAGGTTWGEISDPQNAIHVRADGSDDKGTGSGSAPFASLQAALEASRQPGAPKNIAVGPGTFETNVLVRHDAGPKMTDDDLAIEGCGTAETILEGGGGQYSSEPVILVAAAQNVRLAGFTTEGGRRAIWIWSGATTQIELVDVRNSVRLGIIIGGWDSIAGLTDVNVIDTVTEVSARGIEYGYGISVQDGTAIFERVSISGSTKAGLLVDFGTVTATDLDVDGTGADSDGYQGRAVQAQNWAMLTMEGGHIGENELNQDAGIFAQAALYLDLDTVTVHGTDSGALDGEACDPLLYECPGEGIVVTQGGLGEDPANYQAYLTDNTVMNSSRAGIIIESVVTDLSGNNTANNEMMNGKNSIYVQGDLLDGLGNSILTGDQALDAAVQDQDPSPLNRVLVDIDDLID
jgi:hypothetical protein